MVTVVDPVTGVTLEIPDSLVERYRLYGYIMPGTVSIRAGVVPIERQLAELTNKELIEYGANLGVSCKGKNKAAMIKAIQAHQSKAARTDTDTQDEADAEDDDEVEDDDGAGTDEQGKTSRNW